MFFGKIGILRAGLMLLLTVGCSSHPPVSPTLAQPDPAPAAESAAEPAPPPTPDFKLPDDLPDGEAKELLFYGRRVAEITPELMRDLAARNGSVYTGNKLACNSCHLRAGTAEGVLSWIGASPSYPRYQPRSGRVESLADQIGSCFERNLGTSPPAANSRELLGLVAWLEFLGRQPRPPVRTFLPPGRGADLPAGAVAYQQLCSGCHGEKGAGGSSAPPLWGDESYSDGSGMFRLLLAAAFLRDQMPPANATGLSETDAFDIAAYVNSFARPAFAWAGRDYPALSEKPADCPTPPFADLFPADQHKYGPFEPLLNNAEAARGGDWRRFRESLRLSGAVMAKGR